MNQKLRVRHNPDTTQNDNVFYVPVNSFLEAKKIIDLFTVNDLFLLENKFRENFSSDCCLESWNEVSEQWEECVLDLSISSKEYDEYSKQLFSQLRWDA